MKTNNCVINFECIGKYAYDECAYYQKSQFGQCKYFDRILNNRCNSLVANTNKAVLFLKSQEIISEGEKGE